jgi:hypothetical protein
MNDGMQMFVIVIFIIAVVALGFGVAAFVQNVNPTVQSKLRMYQPSAWATVQDQETSLLTNPIIIPANSTSAGTIFHFTSSLEPFSSVGGTVSAAFLFGFGSSQKVGFSTLDNPSYRSFTCDVYLILGEGQQMSGSISFLNQSAPNPLFQPTTAFLNNGIFDKTIDNTFVFNTILRSANAQIRASYATLDILQ